MNVTKRYLILNVKNEVQRPCDHGVHLPGVKGDKSPSFLNKDSAKAFADILAKKNVGSSFYLAEVLEGTTQYTTPQTPGDWTAAAEDNAD